MLYYLYFLILFLFFSSSLYSPLHFLLSLKIRDQAHCQKHYNHSIYSSYYNRFFKIINSIAMNIFLHKYLNTSMSISVIYYPRTKITNSKGVNLQNSFQITLQKDSINNSPSIYIAPLNSYLSVIFFFFRSWTISCKMETYYRFVLHPFEHRPHSC